MADDVKWIRFKVGTFDGMSFKRIKKAKVDGVVNLRDKLTAVWFELLDLSGKVNNQGFLVNDELAFKSFDDIAIVLDRTPEEIEMCIKWFVNEKMMEITNDIFMISNWSKYQNIDGLEKIQLQNRERQARFKERKKQLALEYKGNVTDNVVVTHGNGVSLIDNNTSSSSSQSTLLSLDLGLESNNKTIDDYFNMFWTIYPYRVGKNKVQEWFVRHKKDITEEFMDYIIKSIELQKTSINWTDKNGQYIPLPMTWLNRGGWNDELRYPQTVQQRLEKRWENFLRDE